MALACSNFLPSQTTLSEFVMHPMDLSSGLLFDAIPKAGDYFTVPPQLKQFQETVLSLGPKGSGLPFHNHVAGILVG